MIYTFHQKSLKPMLSKKKKQPLNKKSLSAHEVQIDYLSTIAQSDYQKPTEEFISNQSTIVKSLNIVNTFI